MVTLLISSNFHVRIICTDVQSAPSHPLTYVKRKKGKSNLKYTRTQKDFSVLLTFLLF